MSTARSFTVSHALKSLITRALNAPRSSSGNSIKSRLLPRQLQRLHSMQPASDFNLHVAPLKCKRGRKSGQLWNGIRPKRLARDTIESRIRELMKRTDEASKAEACRLAAVLLPFEEPKLQAIMAQTETKVTYVARLPEPIQDIEEWHRQMTPLLRKNNK
jgi:hypothetical protein